MGEHPHAFCRWPRRGPHNEMLDHEIEQIRALWLQNVPTKEICKAVYVASRTVRKYVRDLPLREKRLYAHDDIPTMQRLRAMGATIEEIVDVLGYSDLTVKKHVRDIPCPWGRWKLASWGSVDPLMIAELLASGMDVPSLAERFGVSKRTIWVQGGAATRDPDPYRIRRDCQRRLKRELQMLAQSRSSEVSYVAG